MSSPAIWTMTSISRSAIASAIVSTGQPPRAHTLRQALLRALTSHVAHVGVQRGGETVQDAESAKNPQQVLKTHAPLSSLQSGERFARDSGALSQLSLCQAKQLAPCDDVPSDLTKRTTNWWWHGTRWPSDI